MFVDFKELPAPKQLRIEAKRLPVKVNKPRRSCHFHNLDHASRRFLEKAGKVVTTPAERLVSGYEGE